MTEAEVERMIRKDFHMMNKLARLYCRSAKEELDKIMQKYQNAINRALDPDERVIVYTYITSGLSAEKLQYKVGVSTRSIWRIQGKATQKIAKYIIEQSREHQIVWKQSRRCENEEIY